MPRSTGFSRKVDDLGRIVLPAELRRDFDIREGDQVEIVKEDDKILLQKRRINCTFCGGDEGLRPYRNHQICSSCVAELKRF